MIYDTSSVVFLDFLANEQSWPRHFILAVKNGQRLHRQRIFDEAFGCPSVVRVLLSGGMATHSRTVPNLQSGGGMTKAWWLAALRSFTFPPLAGAAEITNSAAGLAVRWSEDLYVAWPVWSPRRDLTFLLWCWGLFPATGP
nr:hypothetical protein Iba_scaffold1400CG0010 [Ipomoea batatas]